MTEKKPTAPYHHGRLRPALLEAAFSLLDSAGVDGVTIRAVARKIGVAHSAPANHFKDRTSLLTAMATLIFDDLTQTITRNLADLPVASTLAAGRARIRVFADTLVTFGLEHPHRYRLLWRRDCLNDEDEELQRGMDQIYEALLAELDGKDASRSSETDAIALWSLLHGYISLRLDGNLIAKTDEETGIPRARAIVDALFDGIRRGD